MSLLRNMTGGLRALFQKKQVGQELDEELNGFLEMAAEEKMKQGMSRKEALREVRLEQGSLEVTKEVVRSAGWESFAEGLWQDLRLGLRVLRKNPAFTTIVILTLALGIGANAAIFTLIDAVMLKSLPVANPTQLYRLGDNNNCCVMVGTQNSGSFVLYSYPLYQNLRDRTPEFTELAAFASSLSDLSVRRRGDSAAEPYKGEFVSGNYFTMFGIRAFAGRLLAPADDSSGALRVAVMSYHTWQQHFGLDPFVIGSTFNINGVPYTRAETSGDFRRARLVNSNLSCLQGRIRGCKPVLHLLPG
jgi:macrolide transport system ATP-binding/permease protein